VGIKSIKEVFEDEIVQLEGTASILDLEKVSDKKVMCVAHIPTKEELVKCFGTDKPNRRQIEDGLADYDDYINDQFGSRGMGFCITVNKDGKETELFFGGWSVD
jgi:hypothetical protein